MQAQTFLERHRPRLIEMAEHASPGLLANAEVETFLRTVHETFDLVADRPGRRAALPGEDVFWWCVTILEELSETPPEAAAEDPHVKQIIDQLRHLAPRLRRRGPLPADYRIYWFDAPE